MPELGSIGASGDLIPLAYITGALIGMDACFMVHFNGEEINALTALERLGLPRLRPKEETHAARHRIAAAKLGALSLVVLHR